MIKSKSGIAKITDLVFDGKNINKGSEFGNALLEKSLREGGAGRSILIDKNGIIIAGNQTVQKAAELGFENVIVVPTDGKSIIAVQRMDLDINSAEGAKMKILDNTVSKHNYVEDVEVVEVICEEYKLPSVKLGLAIFTKDYKYEKSIYDESGNEKTETLDDYLNNNSDVPFFINISKANLAKFEIICKKEKLEKKAMFNKLLIVYDRAILG